MFSVWDAKQFPKASHLSGLQFLQDVCCQCPGFAGINSTEITKERISLIFELREICLSLQMVFSLASAAVACAILDSASGLEPWSVTTAPRYLKLSTSSNFSPLHDSDVNADTIRVIGHQFGLLCTDSLICTPLLKWKSDLSAPVDPLTALKLLMWCLSQSQSSRLFLVFRVVGTAQREVNFFSATLYFVPLTTMLYPKVDLTWVSALNMINRRM